MNRFPSKRPQQPEGTVRLVHRDISPDEVQQMIDLFGFRQPMAALGPELPAQLAHTHNSMMEMMSRDMAKIIARRQKGEISDKDYAFWKSCYPDLPDMPSGPSQ